jgi:hypothetical protein
MKAELEAVERGGLKAMEGRGDAPFLLSGVGTKVEGVDAGMVPNDLPVRPCQ